MSHIKKETVKGFDSVHPVVLQEGLKIAAQLMAIQGHKVSEHILDWSGSKVTKFNGMQIVVGLDADGAANSKKFAGMGLCVDSNGKLATCGDFYYDEQKTKAKELLAEVTKLLGGACYFAARAMIAAAKGQKTEIKVDQNSGQLQLVVQMS